MQKAEYPQRTCREHTVQCPSGVTEYPCELQEYHAGPPASFSVEASVTARDAWEAANPGWEKMGLFQDPFKQVTP